MFLVASRSLSLSCVIFATHFLVSSPSRFLDLSEIDGCKAILALYISRDLDSLLEARVGCCAAVLHHVSHPIACGLFFSGGRIGGSLCIIVMMRSGCSDSDTSVHIV